ncbi:MAG: galactose-1-phosphate uridylyltransferase [Deltaproteobacteria bacterium]|nr:galactose-1-phosphate uridylyltransferase [Deltaproteobacteria bacterium]
MESENNMVELRKHPLLDCWVILNSERAKRPGSTKFPSIAKSGGSCPFCEGNEAITPPEVFVLRKEGLANGKGWRVRVVPNKFAMLQNGEKAETLSDGFYQSMQGIGKHEVVIETPLHDKELHDLEVASVAEVIFAFRERFRELKKSPGIKYVQLFKNYGLMGGGSLEHPHSQIVALPLVPKSAREEESAAKIFFDNNGTCLFCDMIRLEQGEAKRVVFENDRFLVFCPFAPRYAFETWIIPKSHASHFEEMDEADKDQLADAFKKVLMKIQNVLGNAAYNFVICTAPVQEAGKAHYHWRMEILPISSPIGGFERGTGFFVNSVSPENAAEILKEG